MLLSMKAWCVTPGTQYYRNRVHHLCYGNDSLAIARDNMALQIHPDRRKLLLMVLTRDVQADEQGFIPYGGSFFCYDKYP